MFTAVEVSGYLALVAVGLLAANLLLGLLLATGYNPVRAALGRHKWKAFHYATYAAAVMVFIHGIIADPTVSGKAVDYLDGEKVYVEARVGLCRRDGLATRRRRARRLAERLAA